MRFDPKFDVRGQQDAGSLMLLMTSLWRRSAMSSNGNGGQERHVSPPPFRDRAIWWHGGPIAEWVAFGRPNLYETMR